jgi:hypothetical protein
MNTKILISGEKAVSYYQGELQLEMSPSIRNAILASVNVQYPGAIDKDLDNIIEGFSRRKVVIVVPEEAIVLGADLIEGKKNKGTVMGTLKMEYNKAKGSCELKAVDIYIRSKD